MAKVKLSSYLKSVSGNIGGIVFYTCYDREYARIRVTPHNPNTEAQVYIRRSFAGAVKSWQGLPEDKKYRYNKKARHLSMSGYNLYISEYMKERILSSVIKPENNKHSAGIMHASSVQSLCTSVPVPLSLLYGSFSPPIQVIHHKIPA